MNKPFVNTRPQTPYTPQYGTLLGAAHTRPTQEIGAPTLIWHVAVWPKSDVDPENVQFSSAEGSPNAYDDAIREHNRRRHLIMDGDGDAQDCLNELLNRLQAKGRSANAKMFSLAAPAKLDHLHEPDEECAEFANPGTLAFTLWWQDPSTSRAQSAARAPGFDPIRVRVQVEAQPDYFAISFLIDVGKSWHSGSVYSSLEAPGERRRRIFKAVEAIKASCESRLKGDAIERTLLPIEAVTPKKDVPIPGLKTEIVDIFVSRDG
ncbi:MULTISPECIES: hypothetical protein [Rhodomicrobium]|uniref:hypothetical protein n=1 Tax=Rhodomicrobium TaxID=1068 RepID=UPI000B4A6540|nr:MULTISPECIES: hypothetical protein [Rhodomicrobium]